MQSGHIAFNGNMLKKFHQTKIRNLLMKIPRPFCIYGENHIIQSFNFCYDLKFAEMFPQKIYSLELDNEAMDLDLANNVIFFVYPQPEMMNIVASMILKN